MPSDKQRRANERRRLQRQMERRRARAARQKRVTIIASIVGALAIIGVVIGFVVANTGGSSSPSASGTTSSASSSPTASPSASASATQAAYPCTWTKSGTAARKVSVPPTTTPSRTGTVTMAVKTTRGDMTFRLNRAEAPCASESFVSLAAQKYFDDTPCHRLTTSGIYVLQCGDPTGTGSGGPGYKFADELTGKEKYTTGELAMANSGANTNGSQFFIVYKNSQLPPSYTVFGTVTSGLSVVDKVAAAGSTNSNGQGDGKPKLPISLTTVRKTS